MPISSGMALIGAVVAEFVAGRALVVDDRIPGVHIAELGAQARRATRRMLTE